MSATRGGASGRRRGLRVLILDMGSKLNRFGGEARVADLLFRKLGRTFTTYYMGYETSYTKRGKNTMMLERGIGAGARRSMLSELPLVRAGYYFLVVRNMLDMPAGKGRLLEMARAAAPDVVVSNSVQDFAVISYLRKSGMRFSAIYIDHGSVSSDLVSGFLSKEGMPLTIGTGIIAPGTASIKRKFFRYFDVCVALNSQQRRDIARYADRVVCIPNGLGTGARAGRSSRRRARSRLGIAKGDFVVLYVGRMFERQKRASTLVKAVLGTADPRIKLLMVGEGPSLGHYRELAGGSKKIVFLGPAREGELPSIYRASDLFVLPSAWEGFSLTVLEASASGIPMVLSDAAYIEDLRIGVIGKIPSFKVGDAAGLRLAIEKLSSNKRLLRAAAAASKSVSAFFTERKMLDSYASLIREVVSGRSTQRQYGRAA